MKASFLSLPLDMVTDASMPELALFRVPDVAWNSADIPRCQAEDIGVPRCYFSEPGATVAMPSSSPSSSDLLEPIPKGTLVMVTFNEIVVVGAAGDDGGRALVLADLASHHTRVHRVQRAPASTSTADSKSNDDAKSSQSPVRSGEDEEDTCFVLISFTRDANSFQQKDKEHALIAFLDADTRNAFIETADEVSRTHCNPLVTATEKVTPEEALNMVMSQQRSHQQEEKKSDVPPSSKLSPAATCWRVSVLPFTGEVVQAPRDPADLLHESLRVLLEKRAKRNKLRQQESDEEAEEAEQQLVKPRKIYRGFKRLAAGYEEKIEQMQNEVEAMKRSDERKLQAFEMTLSRALATMDERKETVRQSAANYGEQLAEWLNVLQEKQSSELDATMRLSAKKAEYAKALADADANITELYDERRWVESESAKFSSADYVQLMAKRDALVQALHEANQAVAMELREGGGGGSSYPVAAVAAEEEEQQQPRSRSITTEASNRNTSLFSPARVLKMFSPPRQHQQKNHNQQRQQQQATASSSHQHQENRAEIERKREVETIDTPKSARKHHGGSSSVVRTPIPREDGLSKPVKIDQSVQQTLHVNASLRKLLDSEMDGAEQDKEEFSKLQDQVRNAEVDLQMILNAQGAVAVDIQRCETDSAELKEQLQHLQACEAALLAELNNEAQHRTGFFLAAEMDRDRALDTRMKAEDTLQKRKRDAHDELYEKTHEMLRASMQRSLSQQPVAAEEN